MYVCEREYIVDVKEEFASYKYVQKEGKQLISSRWL